MGVRASLCRRKERHVLQTDLSNSSVFEMFSAISTEPQFRRRLDSFFPDNGEGDTISEIVRFREEKEEEAKKKHILPRWLRRLKFPHVIEPQSKPHHRRGFVLFVVYTIKHNYYIIFNNLNWVRSLMGMKSCCTKNWVHCVFSILFNQQN